MWLERGKLIQKAIRIAKKRHGKVDKSSCKRPLTYIQQQQKASKNRLKRLVNQYPSVGVTELAAAIQLLSCFPEDSQPACKAANHICTVLRSAIHTIPGPTLTNLLRASYWQAYVTRSPSGHWPRQNTRALRQWVQDGTKEKVKEWEEVGVAVDDILGLVQRARRTRGGYKLEKHEYIELLKVCMCVHKEDGTHPLGVLADAMVEDCGLEDTWDILLSSSFQMATSKADISEVCQSLGVVAKHRPATFYTQKLMAALTTDEDPRTLMQLFTQQILSTQAPPSMFVYDYMVINLSRGYHLTWVLQVFNTVTVRFKVAPSKHVYNSLTGLMCRWAIKEADIVTEKHCHHVLAATEAAYDGRPPLWVYGEMSKPLVYLMGLKGYRVMYEKCKAKLDELGVREENDRKSRLGAVWRESLYVYLIRNAVMRDDRELALHMLSEMRRWGYDITATTYKHLLQAINQPGHLEDYLPELLKGMAKDLTWTSGASLHSPLTRAVGNVYNNRSQVCTAGRELLKATLSDSTHESCLQQLEALAATRTANETLLQSLEQSTKSPLRELVLQKAGDTQTRTAADTPALHRTQSKTLPQVTYYGVLVCLVMILEIVDCL